MAPRSALKRRSKKVIRDMSDEDGEGRRAMHGRGKSIAFEEEEARGIISVSRVSMLMRSRIRGLS